MYKIKDDVDLEELENFGYFKGILYGTECWVLDELKYKRVRKLEKGIPSFMGGVRKTC